MATAKSITNLSVWQAAEELDVLLEAVLANQLLQQIELVTVSADDEVGVWDGLDNLRNDVN